MTRAASFRQWSRQASARERAVTAAVAVAVVLLVAAALVPAPPHRTDNPLAADTGDSAGATADSAPATAGTTPTDALAEGQSGTPTTRPAASSAVGHDRRTTALTATDTGVTANTIKVGFAFADLDLVQEYGAKPHLREDVSEAIDSFVDYANKRGGVLGRRIEAVKKQVVFAPPRDQRPACIEFTEEDRVFAVIDTFVYWLESDIACITTEHHTLLVNGVPTSAAGLAASAPYQVSVHKDDNRKMKDLVSAAKSTGFFDRANGFRRLGILFDACEPSIIDGPTNGLKAYVRSAGITTWSEYEMTCSDLGSLQTDAARAIQRFALDDVSHVLLAVHPGHMKAFLPAADEAGFHPEYFVGDYLNIIVGGFVQDYPESFHGAVGVTSTHIGEGTIGKPLPPLAQRCSEILVDHGVAPITSGPPDDINNDIEVLELCENFMLFLDAATRAGPHLTRASWLDGLSQVGEFHGATVDVARFGRGKRDGGDTMKLVEWHFGCTCWKQVTGFAPAAG